MLLGAIPLLRLDALFFAANSDRVRVDPLGYTETPEVPYVLGLLDPSETEGPLSIEDASNFLSEIELKAGRAPTMAAWRDGTGHTRSTPSVVADEPVGVSAVSTR